MLVDLILAVFILFIFYLGWECGAAFGSSKKYLLKFLDWIKSKVG
jgi:hypothetical protein